MLRLHWRNLQGDSISLIHYLPESPNASARYFDVETRLVPVKQENGFILDPHDAIPFIDENTIGVIIILGSTYTGHFEDVALMSKLCACSSLLVYFLNK